MSYSLWLKTLQACAKKSIISIWTIFCERQAILKPPAMREVDYWAQRPGSNLNESSTAYLAAFAFASAFGAATETSTKIFFASSKFLLT